MLFQSVCKYYVDSEDPREIACCSVPHEYSQSWSMLGNYQKTCVQEALRGELLLTITNNRENTQRRNICSKHLQHDKMPKPA